MRASDTLLPFSVHCSLVDKLSPGGSADWPVRCPQWTPPSRAGPVPADACRQPRTPSNIYSLPAAARSVDAAGEPAGRRGREEGRAGRAGRRGEKVGLCGREAGLGGRAGVGGGAGGVGRAVGDEAGWGRDWRGGVLGRQAEAGAGLARAQSPKNCGFIF